MNDKSKSILLQVAFKAAVSSFGELTDKTEALVEQRTELFFEQLLALHEKYQIDDQTTRSSYNNSGSSYQQDDAPTIMIDGKQYFDYRGLKAVGAKSAGWPDFKDASGEGFYLTKKDGSPTVWSTKVTIPS